MTMSASFNPTVKLFLTLLVLGIIFWIGAITSRAIIANEFFIPNTLEYSPEITLDTERTLFQLVSATSTMVLIAYGVVLVSAIVLVVKIPLRMKEHGWLLGACILFFLFVPVELFTGYLDLKFILLWIKTKDIIHTEGVQVYVQHSTLMRETLSHRIGALSGLPVIALLCYLTAIILICWRPLRRTQVVSTDSDGDAR